jgi:hypothetical protein
MVTKGVERSLVYVRYVFQREVKLNIGYLLYEVGAGNEAEERVAH